jgi:hypothetical protein
MGALQSVSESIPWIGKALSGPRCQIDSQIPFCKSNSAHLLYIFCQYMYICIEGEPYCAHFIAISLTKWCSASYIYCFLSLYSILPSMYISNLCLYIYYIQRWTVSIYNKFHKSQIHKFADLIFFFYLRKFRKCSNLRICDLQTI